MRFTPEGSDACKIHDTGLVKLISDLLEIEREKFSLALVHQTIIARGQEIKSNLTAERAYYARDAIAKV